MRLDEVIDLAREMGPLATFCTSAADGTPHAVPLVPVWIGSELVFGASVDSLKVRHLQDRSAAAVQYLSSARPHPDALLLKGEATVVTDSAQRHQLWECGEFPFLPLMYSGPTDPNLCFVRFTPARASWIGEGGLGQPKRWVSPTGVEGGDRQHD
jgi:general stress protein 26